jgi:hypothetical protein
LQSAEKLSRRESRKIAQGCSEAQPWESFHPKIQPSRRDGVNKYLEFLAQTLAH